MSDEVTTILGDVKFTYDGYLAEAIVDGETVYAELSDDIDNYNDSAETLSDYLIAFIEMYILSGRKLTKQTVT